MSRPTQAWADAARHPIAWFSALLRGIDRNDRPLIDRALSELDALGFLVRLAEPRRADRLPSNEPDARGVGR